MIFYTGDYFLDSSQQDIYVLEKYVSRTRGTLFTFSKCHKYDNTIRGKVHLTYNGIFKRFSRLKILSRFIYPPGVATIIKQEHIRREREFLIERSNYLKWNFI